MDISGEELPSYEEFGQEVLAGVDELDSLDLVEVAMSFEEDNPGFVSEEDLQRITALPDRERRMTVLSLGLKGGMEFETTMLGIPVMVQPIPKSTEPPRRTDGSGDREPRNPPDPSTPGAMALAMPA